MTKRIIWRLGKLPSPDEVRDLVKDKIITQEEAREILFNSEDEIDRDKKGLESEIKFLRQLVEKLSSNQARVVEIIKTIEKPYYHSGWYQPYNQWCYATAGTSGSVGTSVGGSSYTLTTGVAGSTGVTSGTAGSNSVNLMQAVSNLAGAGVTGDTSFSGIKTF